MWSIGVIIYILLCGYPPFQSEVRGPNLSQRMEERILAGDFVFHDRHWRGISPEAKEVCCSIARPLLGSRSPSLLSTPTPFVSISRRLSCSFRHHFHDHFPVSCSFFALMPRLSVDYCVWILPSA
jgi:hypothetical protein